MTGGETSANIVGSFLNAAGTMLYVIATNALGGFYWRRVDITNPLAPVGSEWTVSSRAHLTLSASDALGDQNVLFLDTATNFAYMVWSAPSGGDQRLAVARVDMATGIVTYADKSLTAGSLVIGDGPVRGVAVISGSLHVLHTSDTGASQIAKYTLASLAWGGSWSGVPATTLAPTSARTVLASASEAFVAIGLTVASDGKLLIFYDDAGKVEKYNPTAYTYEGSVAWVASDIGSISSRSGFIWTLNDVGVGENIQLKRWYDQSTGVVSAEKSLYHLPDRQVSVGENDTVQIRFEARDDFGAPMPSLAGQTCRFEIVTNRGALDGDDAALSTTTTPSSFRGAGNIPLNRQLSVVFDSSGIATVYFQSARTSSQEFPFDRVRIDYP